MFRLHLGGLRRSNAESVMDDARYIYWLHVLEAFAAAWQHAVKRLEN
jgi:hypothetical protein